MVLESIVEGRALRQVVFMGMLAAMSCGHGVLVQRMIAGRRQKKRRRAGLGVQCEDASAAWVSPCVWRTRVCIQRVQTSPIKTGEITMWAIGWEKKQLYRGVEELR